MDCWTRKVSNPIGFNGINYTNYVFETKKATYKIPGFGEMAKKFTVKFYRDGHIHHPERIYGSKAIGEPPLFLGSSVYYAIVDAVHQARQEKKAQFCSISKWFISNDFFDS